MSRHTQVTQIQAHVGGLEAQYSALRSEHFHGSQKVGQDG
jgi:hypothetical protein